MIRELEGKVAVVTGAASGIGNALCRRFAAEGMKVVLADIEADALERARAELAAEGCDTHAVRTDVSQADDVQRLAESSLEAFGRIHLVCNNAGVFTGGCAWEAPLSDYEWVVNVNVWGVIHGIRSFVPILLSQNEPAHLVNTASMAGVTSTPYTSAYTMSKHAVVALSETLFHELSVETAPVGVSVLCPELINTGIARSERNRPPYLKRPEEDDNERRDMVEQAIRDLVPTGLDPSEMARRVVEAVAEDRFYILSAEGGSWRESCLSRLEDIRLGRNPTLNVTAGN